jgi:hypothetical protein
VLVPPFRFFRLGFKLGDVRFLDHARLLPTGPLYVVATGLRLYDNVSTDAG